MSLAYGSQCAEVSEWSIYLFIGSGMPEELQSCVWMASDNGFFLQNVLWPQVEEFQPSGS